MAANQLLVENSNKLRMAIGRAVMHWSAVEMETQFIFRALFGDDTDTADIVWGTLVSMDARLSVLQKLLTQRTRKGRLLDDALLLIDETRRCYKNRNQIAHAGLILEKGVTPYLEPFFVIGSEGAKLYLSDVEARSEKFIALLRSLNWLHRQLVPKPAITTLPKASFPQPTDLILALRAEQDRIRKEQSAREKLLRHALKLQREGRLPDWPA